jgi:hypothetical protein
MVMAMSGMALKGTAGAAIEAGAALLLLLLLAKSTHTRHNRRRMSKDKQDADTRRSDRK